MKTFQANEYEDLLLGPDGKLGLLSGRQALAQSARQYMRTRRGEMIHQRRAGIPFEQLAWSGAPNLIQFEAEGRERLSQLPEVEAVQSFGVDQDADVLRYEATLMTTFGEVTINDDF